jgi:hypothetical protein
MQKSGPEERQGVMSELRSPFMPEKLRRSGRGAGQGAEDAAAGCFASQPSKGLAVLFTGQVADQAFDHCGGIGIPFRQIDQRAARG